jgi:Helix-turn-helix of DDE superfamily endonuclease/DDE superfamily endonuclease
MKQRRKLPKTTSVHRSRRLQRLLDAPKTFQALTGVTPEQFHRLVAKVEPLFWEDDAKRRAMRPNRQRKTGAGKQLELTVPEILFMTLLYYRTYITHVFVGFLMDIDDGNVWRYFKRMEPVLARVFKVPERSMDMDEDAVWELIVDATEQKAYRRKGTGYSGKKKSYTLKTQFIVGRDRRIRSISKSIPGQRSDKKLYDQTKAYVRQESVTRHNKAGPPPRLAGSWLRWCARSSTAYET